MHIRLTLATLGLLLVSVIGTDVGTNAQTNQEKLHFTAFAVNMSNVGTGTTGLVEIDINSWSTPEERARIIETALANDQKAVVEILQKMPSRGRMWFPQWEGPDPLNARLGWDLRYTAQNPLPEGGRRVVSLTDRPISLWEARNQPRTIDYPFTLIQIEVDKDGNGQGKLSIASRIRFDKQKNVLELEDYASEPVRLTKVKMTVKRT